MAGSKPRFFYVFLWAKTQLRFIIQKKNEANIQPTFPNELGKTTFLAENSESSRARKIYHTLPVRAQDLVMSNKKVLTSLER